MHYQWTEENLLIDCSIQPKSKEDKIVGTVGDFLKIRITAPPVDGKANSHLVKFLAEQFKVKRSAITIVSGHSGRHKRVAIQKPKRIPGFIKSESN